MSYYKDELDKVKIDPTYGAKIKVLSEGNSTHWMTLNKESIKVLTTWLKENKKQLILHEKANKK